MSFVYQAGVFTSYAINLGLADKQLQNQLLSTQAGTAASLNKLPKLSKFISLLFLGTCLRK
jgi:hypothetical protein